MTTRVVLDAMGGDDAPGPVIEGAVAAARNLKRCQVVLVGPEQTIRESLARVPNAPQIEILHAADVIGMHDHATDTIRARPEASINVGLRLVKSGDAHAFVTAGNTGATMAAALLTLGRVRGISRPALALVYSTPTGKRKLLLDVGANADCRPLHLIQFAHMGSAFMRGRFTLQSPAVGLLSIGEEDSKGNAVTIEVNEALRASQLNFVGNVEGNDILRDTVDITVCDGFAGNILLKTVEGVAETLFAEIRKAATAKPWNRIAGLMLKPELRKVRDRLDYSEYGGAQLLGVEGIVVISHGRSNARAIFNAVRAARDAHEAGALGLIREVGATMPARKLDRAED
ncbi:MAG: phosphate acyltransferase PlsX [Dehalococcoidia bacterium]